MKAQIWRRPSESEFKHGYVVGFTTDKDVALDRSMWINLTSKEDLLPLFEQALKEGFKIVLEEK